MSLQHSARGADPGCIPHRLIDRLGSRPLASASGHVRNGQTITLCDRTKAPDTPGLAADQRLQREASSIEIALEKVARPPRLFLTCSYHQRRGSHPVSTRSVLTFETCTHAPQTLQGPHKASGRQARHGRNTCICSQMLREQCTLQCKSGQRRRERQRVLAWLVDRDPQTHDRARATRAAQSLPRLTMATARHTHPNPLPTPEISGRCSRPTPSASSEQLATT